ncbi:MAG TPA: DUF2786 domain-containing protein [Mycobacteriales bacterium]|nr:DUF2786 domain-containing protein [Mycobacteriales bacterium]
MGVKNKQRRAAKKRRNTRRGSASAGRPAGFLPPVVGPAEMRSLLVAALEEMEDGSTTPARISALLLEPSERFPADVARAGVRSLLADLTASVIDGGWSPSDLAEVTRRVGDGALVPLAVGLVAAHTAGFPPARVAPAWAADLRAAGPAAVLRLDGIAGMTAALELALVMVRLPPIPAVLPAPGDPGGPADAAPADQKLLARVQALLAKAEATEFDDEADALSAKAQELVSRYALERLLAQTGEEADAAAPVARRMWIDAPYVLAKAMLVDVVARANRCRSVVAEKLGHCTLVGSPADLDAVELLVPSLLVQAHSAMSRFGRLTDRSGTSRTRSFRSSFLTAYATRIGERLAEVDASAVSRDARAGELVPLVQRQRDRVDAACEELFPHLVTRATPASNGYGWAAGRAAADEALLGADLQVSAAAG